MSSSLPRIGTAPPIRYASAVEALTELKSFVIAVNDPPWTLLEPKVPAPVRVVTAGSMELDDLEAVVADHPHDGVAVVGLGGGTALDTAKFLAWRLHSPLMLVPSVLSVDAAFTETVGVRVDRRVRYVGEVDSSAIVVDVPLIQSAPPRFNRAGAGDLLSCHTALWDWAAAAELGLDQPWHDDLASLARAVLAELERCADDIAAVSNSGVRFLVDALSAVGAACRAAGHARFEEGSEHFLAYALEQRAGIKVPHGELIAMCVVAIAHIQSNNTDEIADLVTRCRLRANPEDIGLFHEQFVDALVGLRDYARAEGLWHGVADFDTISSARAERAWDAVCALPRLTPSEA